MKVKVVAIGKLKSMPIAELVEDYKNRIDRYLSFDLVAYKDEPSVKLDKDDFLVVCDENGEETTSKGLADFIARHQSIGTKKLTFFVGDAKGVGKVMKERSKTTLSLSKMTFTHEMARAILLEQIYRACTILRGEKYHYG